ncbi:MAG: hypothetical protein EBU90_01445 [Proteobacteria bacterium]|nr:hypothetical protein [Pseudomonadota bacterium]
MSVPFFTLGFSKIEPKFRNYTSSNFIQERIESIKKCTNIKNHLYLWASSKYTPAGEMIISYRQRFGDRTLFFEEELEFGKFIIYNEDFQIRLFSKTLQKLIKEPLFCENIITEHNNSLKVKMITLITDSIYVFRCQFKNLRNNSKSEEFLLFVDHYKMNHDENF